MPPSIPPAKGSDPEDVAWALQTADALWRRSERTDALSWLRRAVQAAGEADDPERAFALADAAAELTEQLSREPPTHGGVQIEIRSNPPPSLRPDASGSVDISMDDDIPEVSARFAPSFPPGAAAEIDDLLGGGSSPPPESAPRSAPASDPLPPPPQELAKAGRPPPLPPRRKPLPPAVLPPPSARDVAASSSATPVAASSSATPVAASSSAAPVDAPESAVGSRPIPIPRGSFFEDSTPFLPGSESDEHEHAASSPRSSEQLAEGFDSLVRKHAASPPPAAVKESDPPLSAEQYQFTVPAPPQFTEPPPEILQAMEEPMASDLPPVESRPPEPALLDAPDAPAAVEVDGRLRRIAHADAFADLPDDARDLFVAAGIVHSLSRDEEVPAVALCYVLEGEVRVSSAVVDAAGLILKQGEVLRARGTIEANLPLRLSAHSDDASVVTWNAHAVEDAFASCPWVEGDLRAIANRTLAICGATIGPLGERLDESIFLDVMSRFEVSVLLPGEILVEKGSPLPGLCIVGVGVVQGDGEQGPGDFVFAQGVLSLAPSPSTFVAGTDGALVLVATRALTQELLVTCPPLLEILAGM